MTIQQYQKECFTNYKSSIGYPITFDFFHGTQINPLVPIETVTEKAMIVGAYPSAKFFTIDGETNVPVASNNSPFSDEHYFDGSRVRQIPSGKELNEVILQRIGIERKDCWITNLVKVFLFKEGHIKKYNKLGKYTIEENRSSFEEYAKKSIKWLEMEIGICSPGIIIILGYEAVKVFFGLSTKNAKEYLNGEIKVKEIGGIERNIICLPHPGILMKKTKINPWPERFEKEISIIAKNEIEKIKRLAVTKRCLC